MKKISQLMNEIMVLTAEIETVYPELYQYLDETPVHLGETKEKAISTDDLKQYLQTLKDQLNHHKETHKNKG